LKLILKSYIENRLEIISDNISNVLKGRFLNHIPRSNNIKIVFLFLEALFICQFYEVKIEVLSKNRKNCFQPVSYARFLKSFIVKLCDILINSEGGIL